MPSRPNLDEAPGALDFCARHLRDLAENGYHAFPIRPGTKRADWAGWSAWCPRPPRPDQIARWRKRHGHFGIAIATGHACVAVDSDEEDPRRAAEVAALAESALGPTLLVRIGHAPRWVRVYRPGTAPMRSRRLAPTVELIAAGRYFVSHNIHPGTGQPYAWPDRAPETCPLAEVPTVEEDQIARFATLLAGLYGLPVPPEPDDVLGDVSADAPATGTSGGRVRAVRYAVRPDLPYPRDAQGRICDGREEYLTRCVYTAFCAGATEAADIADAAWARFAATADLTRGKRDGPHPWTHTDALAKARALVARGKPRPARRAMVADEPWTLEQLAAFQHAVDARGARGALAPSAVAVSHAMLSYARTSGVCCASPPTLAAVAGLSLSTVKTARRALIAAGFWSASNAQGGRARGADYRPVIVGPAHPAGAPAANRTIPPRTGNGARLMHPSNRFGFELPSPGEARDGPPRSASDLDLPSSLGSVSGSEAASPGCHAQRETGATIRVAQVPSASVAAFRKVGDEA
ncbi:hypothetical protein ASF36_25145 [Methylobacterium sp. Leaf90]|nr:hypothetical protein ASF36_25145 [Methylobacterium sp. Leaf90]